MPLVAYITIDIDPVPFHIGPVPVHWYGIIMAAAVLVGGAVFARRLPRYGIAADHGWSMALLAIPLAIVGARVFHILDDFGYYWHHPGQLWTAQLVGLAIYGVLTGGVLGVLIYCRWKRLPFLRVLDALALALPVGQLIGKCANIINGDTWGYPTRLPWGFVYRNPHAFLPSNLLGVPTQPTPVYEQLWLLVVVAVLIWATPRLKIDGVAFLLYLGLYSLGRFFISFERVNNILFLHLREAQLVAAGVLIAVVPVALLLWRRRVRLQSSPPADARTQEREAS